MRDHKFRALATLKLYFQIGPYFLSSDFAKAGGITFITRGISILLINKYLKPDETQNKVTPFPRFIKFPINFWLVPYSLKSRLLILSKYLQCRYKICCLFLFFFQFNLFFCLFFWTLVYVITIIQRNNTVFPMD